MSKLSTSKSSILSIDLPPPAPTGNIFTGWTVLGNSIVGTGMLGLAYALSVCGWIVGLTMFAMFGVLSLFSLHIINAMSMAMPNKRLSYYSVAHLVAPNLKIFIDVVMIIHNVGVDTAYLQVFGSMGLALLEFWSPGVTDDGRRWFVRAGLILGIIVLLAPICFFKKMSFTAPTSAIGITCFLYVVISGVYYCLTHGVPVGDTSLWPAGTMWDVLAMLPVFIFGFACHFNAFPMAEDMKDRTQGKLDTVAGLSMASTLCLYLPAMIIPYTVFGDTVSDNFYMSLPIDNISIHIGYVLLPFAVLTAFPLLLLPARTSMVNLFGTFYPEKQDSTTVHVVSTLIFLLATAVLAMAFESLGVTMSLIGILGTNTITFIMPTYLYCRMFQDGPKGPFATDDGSSDRKKSITWYCSAALFVFSCALFPICLTGLIYTLV